MSLVNYIYLSTLLFAIGAATVLVRRNAIVVFMGVELMLNATNLTFVTFARMHGSLDGQVIALFVMVVAAAEVVVGLAIIMAIFRARRSASVDAANLLKLSGAQHASGATFRWASGRAGERGRHTACLGDDFPGMAVGRPPASWRCHPPARRVAHQRVRTGSGNRAVLGQLRPRGVDLLRDAWSFGCGACTEPAPVLLGARRELPGRGGNARRPALDGLRAAGHLRRFPDPGLLPGLHGARPGEAPVLRISEPVRRGHAAARPGRLVPPALCGLGRRAPRVTPAHWLLAPQPGVRHSGQQGVRGQQGR